MDRRLWPATQRAAHISLQGKVVDIAFTAGQDCEIATSLADLCAAPQGALDRQLIHGEAFCMIDQTATHAFGFARKDGYCGWLRLDDLRPARPKTHWVTAPTHCYPAPRVQAAPALPLPFGARVQVLGQSNGFAQTDEGYVPSSHLRTLQDWHTDPATIATGFLHSPYLWGGNSHAGIDCSGLVQAAFMGCGDMLLGDSDLQQNLGQEIGQNAALQRNDLLFWRGHVALVVDEARLIHANAHTMSVAYENIIAATARIAGAGGGDITHRRRFTFAD